MRKTNFSFGLAALVSAFSPSLHAGPVPYVSQAEAPKPALPAAASLSDPRGDRLPDGSTSFLGKQALPEVPFMATMPVEQSARERARAFFMQALPNQRLELINLRSDTDAGETTTYVRQAVRGVPIEGTYGVAVADDGTLRYSRQHFVTPPSVDTEPQVSAEDAQATAVASMQATAAWAGLQDDDIPNLVIVYDDATPHLAWRIGVATHRPWEGRAVYVDAHDGGFLTYAKTSHDGVSGRLKMKVEPLCNGDKPVLRAMPHTQWQDDVVAYTDAKGAFKKDTDVKEAVISLKSPYVDLRNRSGDRAGPWHKDLQPSPADNVLTVTSAPLDQVDPFYHVHTVRSWLLKHAKSKNSQVAWANRKLRVNVNVDDTCNAYFDGSLNFFQEGDGCLNTGRTAGVVYHEYGHGIHDHSSSDSFADGQVGEGIADYVAATITNNPNMRGLFACDDNFRSCVNELTYCEDDCDLGESSEVHDAGQIMCAVLWETRAGLIDRYGQKKGVDKSDRLFLRFLGLVGDVYSSYEALIAADEDDDGDPSNGTAHSCEINKAFKNPARGAVRHFPKLKKMVPCNKN